MATLRLIKTHPEPVASSPHGGTEIDGVQQPTDNLRTFDRTNAEFAFNRLWNYDLLCMLDKIGEGVVFFDLLDHILLINSRARKLLGIKLPVLTGHEIPLMDIHGASRIGLESLVDRAKRSRSRSVKEVVQSPNKANVYEIVVTALVDRQNLFIGTLCEIRDITQAWNDSHKKSEFLSMIAHELLNPLTPVKEGLSLVLEESIGPLNPTQKQCLSVAHEEINRLSRLVNDLLEISRMDSGKIRIKREMVDLSKLMREVIDSIEHKAQHKRIRIDLYVRPDLTELYADPDRMRQVLINLADNAIKYSPEGSNIQISAVNRTRSIEMAIRDNGFGIRKSDIPRLFERFSQLDYPEHRIHRERGTGLGLSIVREIIRLHQGRIRVQSEYGKGSTFIIQLPKRKRAR